MQLLVTALILILVYLPMAFAGCAITPDANGNVVIPAGTTSIANDAYSGCTTLISVSIPASVTGIGSGAFYLTSSMTTATFASGSALSTIGDNMHFTDRELLV